MTLVPFGLVFAFFLVLAWRLLRTARRTGGSEFWLALFFLAAAISVVFRVPTIERDLTEATWVATANGIGHVFTTVAVCSFNVFVWRVFRAQDRWATGLSVVSIAAQLVALAALLGLGGYQNERNFAVIGSNAVRSVPFAWGFIESLRYHRLMKLRLRMNLADSVVANRFGLFSIWSGALFVLPIAFLIVRLVALIQSGGVLDPTAVHHDWVMPVVRSVLLATVSVSFIALWLSFFPPRAYVDRLRSRIAAG